VEGHTDDRPTHSKHFVSNWDLSAARAVSVVQYLADEYAYPPETMAVAGYASGRPVVTNDSEENRQTNRRVDIVLLAAPENAGVHPSSIPAPTNNHGVPHEGKKNGPHKP
jgi:chemotaxis protein MotB